MATIKAIETQYKGYRFRSRLEARWAVFFDNIGIRWRYEVEGFEIPPHGRYLPDFHLPDWNLYLEIKPDLPYEDMADDDSFIVASKGKKLTSLGKLFLGRDLLHNSDPNEDGRRADLWMLCGSPGRPVVKSSGKRWVLHDGAVALAPRALGVIPMMAFCVNGSGDVDFNTLYEEGDLTSCGPVTGYLFPRGKMGSLYIGLGRTYSHRTIIGAYQKARSARFEFGENGR